MRSAIARGSLALVLAAIAVFMVAAPGHALVACGGKKPENQPAYCTTTTTPETTTVPTTQPEPPPTSPTTTPPAPPTVPPAQIPPAQIGTPVPATTLPHTGVDLWLGIFGGIVLVWGTLGLLVARWIGQQTEVDR